MPLLRPSPSDFTAVVKALANAGAAVSNPQGSRPPSKGGVAFVNVSTVAAMIRGSPRLVSIAPTIRPVVPIVDVVPTLPIDPYNYTTYETNLVFLETFPAVNVTRDVSGNFYGRPADYKYYKYSPTGTKTFLAGDGNTDSGVFTPGLGAAARFGGNGGVKQAVLDSSGNLFTVHTDTHRIIKIAPNGNVTSFAGTGTAGTGDGPAATAAFYYPIGIAIDASNTLYVSELNRKNIRKITSSGQVSTLTFSSVFDPYFYGLAVDSTGVIYGVETSLHRVYKIIPTGPASADIALLAGSTQGYANGQGSAARFYFQQTSGICVDTFGNVYVGDTSNGSVRKISPSGNVITIAGTGVNAGDRPLETNTLLYFPNTLMIDANGILYIQTSASIRKISPLIASLANAGNNDGFVVKYTSDGTALWARRVGGTLSDNPTSVSTDSSGNIVVTGRYASNPLAIYNADGTTFTTLANAGSQDGFVVKYDSIGTPLWARRVGGTNLDSTVSVSTDSSGNIVVSGFYASTTLTIYNADGTTAFTTLANAGSDDSFVVKYDSIGTPLWARRVGGTGSNDVASSVSTDSSGNIVVVGRYASNPLAIYNADGTTFTTLANAGSDDGFVVKYNSAGTPQWVRRVGGTSGDNVSSVDTDSSGNIVVVGGYTSNPVTVFAADGTTAFTTLANAGANDSFVVKYDSIGTPLWARRVGGTLSDSTTSISVDSSGNIVVVGGYTSNPVTVFAADGTTTFTTLTNSGSFDTFVVKYDSIGTPLWARRVGGTNLDSAVSVSTDSSGNIVVAGYYDSNPVTVFTADGTTAFTTLANVGYDSFVVKYDSIGTPLWARRVGGANNELIRSVSTDSSGNIIMTGEYASNPLTITVE
jgi:hypothetical protein